MSNLFNVFTKKSAMHNIPDSVFWHVNIDDIESVSHFENLLKSLTPQECEKVMKFYFFDDRKRAILSILLQKAMIRHCFLVSDDEYIIERTKENKPYLKLNSAIGNWNFNVSHHGKFVSIASHSHLLMGVDLVDILTRSPNMARSALKYVEMFSAQLTPKEMQLIESVSDDAARYTLFFVLWSLKESYIKAIGLGLGFDLTKIDFDVHMCCSAGGDFALDKALQSRDLLKGWASATIHGVKRTDWRFDFFSVDDRHVMSVARGPVSDAIPSYKAAAGWSGVTSSLAVAEETRRHLAMALQHSKELRVTDLLVPSPVEGLAPHLHPRLLVDHSNCASSESKSDNSFGSQSPFLSYADGGEDSSRENFPSSASISVVC